MKRQLNLLTVDLEEWFMVEVLSERVKFEAWNRMLSTVVRNSRRLINLFERKGVRATWFALGWCAQRYPDLIREIVDSGHEIACHSYRHRHLRALSPEAFRADTERSLEAITRAGGVRPVGYRAPSWSIDPQVAWAFEILADLGFEYDSSMFPIKHDLYGMPGGPREPFKMTFDSGRSLFEVPATTYRFMGQNMPLGGGGYLRHSPYWYSSRMIRKLNRQGQSVVVYVHPWEIDPETPRIDDLSALQRFRLYGSVGTLDTKLERLLDEFEFSCMIDFVRHATRRKIGFGRN